MKVGWWPLVGRDDEVERVRSLLFGENDTGAIITGVAGVGKTRHAQAVLELAENAGLEIATVMATKAAADLPFGAMAHLLPSGEWHEAKAVDDRSNLLRRYVAALSGNASDRRLVMLIDDAHLLDDASATLVHELAQIRRVFLVVTVRSGEQAPDPIVALWKNGLVERVALGGLSTRSVEKLVSSVLDGPVDRATITALAERCQGNVLFLRELVLGGLQDGSLRKSDGVWLLARPLSPSDRLVELVETRFFGLRPDERALLEVVSFGEPIGPAELTALADPDLAERLEKLGLLASRMDGRRLQVRLAHPIYGDVVRSRVSALRSTAIVRSLAEVVEGTGARRRDDVLRVATWRLIGGGGDPELLLAGATTARLRYDFPLAERLARAAVDAGAGFSAKMLLAQVQNLQGRTDEAERALAILATEACDDAERGAVAVARIDSIGIYGGRISEGIALADEANAKIANPEFRTEIAARRAAMLGAAEGPRRAVEATAPLLEEARGSALSWACVIGSLSSARLGKLESALEISDLGYHAQRQTTPLRGWYPWTHIYFRCQALAYLGRIEEAEAVATDYYDLSLAEQSAEAQAMFAWSLCGLVGEQGHVNTAIRYGRESFALMRSLGRPQPARECLVPLSLALALAGKAVDATEALKLIDTLGPPTFFTGRVDVLQSRAWTHVAAGRVREGCRYLTKGAEVGERTGDLVGAVTALHGLARLGLARQVVMRLQDLAKDVDGPLVMARVDHCDALAQRDPDRLQEVSDAFDAMGAHLLAAEAVADAAGEWRRRGVTRRSATARTRATVLASRCEGAVTPALGVRKPPLTAAQEAVARLAASGLTSRAIAIELAVSVRTVENHLQRVYEALGVSSRIELRERLGERSQLLGPSAN